MQAQIRARLLVQRGRKFPNRKPPRRGPWGWTPGGGSELTLWTDWRVAPLTHKDQEGVGDGGRAIWPGEATGEAPALPSPTVSAPRPLPPWRQTARCGPGSREVQGRGWRLCSSGAGPAQRGQEARTPGIVSRNHSPAPVREEVLPGALRRCLPGYIVEQETRQRGSRTVEEGARDAEPTRACRGKWRRGRRADAPRCPGKQGSGKEPRPGPLLIQPETLSSSGRPCAGNPARSFSRPGRDASGKALLRFRAASPASPLETPPRAMVGA